MAQKLLPETIRSSRDLDAQTRFLAVYVLDHRGEIRRHEDVTVIDLGAMTRRFLPTCTPL